jgi:sec-independent protein translocase protein TatA
MGIGLREILILVLIVVLVFGARKIPSILGDFGKGIKNFRKGLGEGDDSTPPRADEPPPRQLGDNQNQPAAKPAENVRQGEP